jgi:aspartate 1-decarboxylase
MSKIHRATVTDGSLNYVGSITIDQDIIEAAGIKPFQMVIINNVSNAVSWQTYVLAGKKGKGQIILNGPPARLFHPGDKVIILAEAFIEPSEYKNLKTKIVFLDDENKVTRVAVHKASAK